MKKLSIGAITGIAVGVGVAVGVALNDYAAVSYTHLTLPTILLV